MQVSSLNLNRPLLSGHAGFSVASSLFISILKPKSYWRFKHIDIISFRVLNLMQYPVTAPRLLAYVSARYFLSSRAEDIDGDPGFAPRAQADLMELLARRCRLGPIFQNDSLYSLKVIGIVCDHRKIVGYRGHADQEVKFVDGRSGFS
jgi:hypothetical protein